MPRKPKQAKKQTESTASEPAPSYFSTVEQARESVARGAAMVDRCIAKVSSMLEEGGEYDDRLASHLAWLLDKHAKAMEALRRFGEKVKTQSLELTPDQTMRAIAKYIQTSIPVTKRDYFRGLLDTPIDDIGLIQ